MKRWLLATIIILLPLFAHAAKQQDVRILFEVSHANAPAQSKKSIHGLLSLIDTIPEGSRAGIWTFSKFVNLIQPLTTVNTQWRKQAKAKVLKLKMVGQGSNLSTGLAQATVYWHAPSQKVNRQLFIFNSGQLNLGGNAKVNKTLEHELLHDMAPVLKRYGVNVWMITQQQNSFVKQWQQQTQGQVLPTTAIHQSTWDKVFTVKPQKAKAVAKSKPKVVVNKTTTVAKQVIDELAIPVAQEQLDHAIEPSVAMHAKQQAAIRQQMEADVAMPVLDSSQLAYKPTESQAKTANKPAVGSIELQAKTPSTLNPVLNLISFEQEAFWSKHRQWLMIAMFLVFLFGAVYSLLRSFAITQRYRQSFNGESV